MDLAESILNELVTLQKKNEELLGIISRLEHESDVIIRQFEDKIADLNKNLKKAQDVSAKSEKKYDTLCREKNREHESFEKDKKELEDSFLTRISDLEKSSSEYLSLIQEKETLIQTLTDQVKEHENSASQTRAEYSTRIQQLTDQLESQKGLVEKEKLSLRLEYEDTLTKTRDEVARKEQELRTLASDLKSRIADEKRSRKEREKELAEYNKKISELQTSLESSRAEYKTLQSLLAEETKKSAKKVQDLTEQIKELEKEKTGIKSDLAVKITDLERQVQSLREQSEQDAITIEDLTRENTDLIRLSDELEADVTRKGARIVELSNTVDSLTTDMESTISQIQSDISQKDQDLIAKEARISELNLDVQGLEEQLRADEKTHAASIQSFSVQIEDLQNQLGTRDASYREETSKLTARIEEIAHDLDEMIQLKAQREQEFRDEITYLHEELIRRKEEWKAKLESGARDIAERDRHITLISGNNEALRAELERVRTRLLMLEKTIREDKEEPVHALYRQIQNLSGKLAAKESENSVLASRIIRLDTENTRLAQLLTDIGCPAESESGEEKTQKPEAMGSSPAPTRSDILKYLTNLDDPMHAMDAAASILRFGPQVTDMLIPLLYQGPQNRRAWVAVLLYELNDPRATKPLSDLLETSETGLRELIWDTRLRFREYRRSGASSTTAQ